jgi:large subunit ribosomal protein L9
MDVILLKTMDNLGKLGSTVNVARGYARNYLLPQGLAVEATEGNRKVVAERMVLEARRDHARKEAAETLAASLVAKDLTVTIEAKASEEDRLYGSVSARDIAAAVTERHGLDLDHHQVVLAEPIKELGEYELAIKLHPEVQVPVKVVVAPAG